MTTIADTFNRANESPLATSSDGTWSWTDVTGTSSVSTNKCVLSATTMLSRAQTDLASDDHEVHADFHTFSAIGICARFAAAASTFYLLQCLDSVTLQLYKCVAGSFTQLGSNVVITTVAGDTFKLECNTDDSIKGYQNGVLKITATSETSITGNTRTGLRADAASATYDNFGAADLGGGGSTLSSTVGSVSGVGTLTGVTNKVWNTVGNSTGLGTATAVGQAGLQVQTVGTSAGLGTAVGVTNTVTNAVGNATGTATVAAVGVAVQPGSTIGTATGIATVSGVAVTIANAVGNSSGTSDAQGVNPQVVVNQIGVIVGAGFEPSWRDHVKAIHEKRMLEGRIREQEKELKKVEKKLKTVAKKVEAKEKPEGILATYLQLELKKDEIENKIQALEVDLEPLIMAIEKWEIEEDDNEFMSLQ